MKTILVPTDFSKNAENALHFAIALAKQQKATLILLHAYQMPVAVSPVPFNLLILEKEEAKQDATAKLRTLCAQIDHAGGVSYEYLLEEGDAVEIISNTVKEKNVDLIVMGSKGASGLAGVIFGGVATSVIEKASCPVMAIPESTSLTKPIKKITYATDYQKNDTRIIAKIIELAEPIRAQVNIIHISKDGISSDEESKLMSQFMKKVNDVISYNNLSFQMLHGQDVEEQLEKYIADNSTDVLILSTHHRSFFDRLFENSITKDLTLKATIPLVAFHYNN
jgi:nucleotide-binding universal stress UspA family protein